MSQHRTTLAKLFGMVKKDRRLLDAVLQDPEKALSVKGLSLSSTDLQALKRWLKKTYKIPGKRLAKMLVNYARGNTKPPWPS